MVEALFTIGIFAVCCVIFVYAYRAWDINQARRKGIYPPQGKATIFDVRRLILLGEKKLAICVYREIFHVGEADAIKNVEELEKYLNTKT